MVNRFSRKVSLKLFRPMLRHWREMTHKRRLLKRVFRLYINACEERVALGKSNYSLMVSVVREWRECAVMQRIVRIETNNECKALFFRGISLKAKVFFYWVDVTATNKQARLEAEAKVNAVSKMIVRVCFAELKSLWQNNSVVWQKICNRHSVIVRGKVLLAWSAYLSTIFKWEMNACQRIHMKYFLQKLRKMAIRARGRRLYQKIASKRLQLSFLTMRRIYLVLSRVKRATGLCSNIIRNYRLRRILNNWPGRKEWAMSEALRKRRIMLGRGRIRLVDVAEKDSPLQQVLSANEVFDKSLIQAAKPRPNLVQRIARMVSGVTTASYNGLCFIQPPTLPELLELVTTILGAWRLAVKSVRTWRSKSRQIRSARSRKILFEAMRHWISRSSKTSHRIMTWVQKKDSILSINSSAQFSRLEKFRRLPGSLGAVTGGGDIGTVNW